LAVCAAITLGVAMYFRALWRFLRSTREADDSPEQAWERRKTRRQLLVHTAIGVSLTLLIVGAIAIPNFMNFGVKAKSSEAKSNLGAIRSIEVAYFAEWNVYVGNQPPTPPPHPNDPRRWRYWNVNTRFSILGFAPEGGVYCAYALEGPDFPKDGFVARAECDYDGDGKLSVWTITNKGTEVIHSGDDY
jgi:type IV pilus assembly protein PilA